MKKIFVAFASVTMLAASAFFMSCSDGSDSSAHEHNFSSEWTSNESHHWHAATCEHKDQVKAKGEHTFGEWTVIEMPSNAVEGKRERECSVCHYKTEEKIAKLDHVHAKGVHHNAVAGTCRTKGTIEYNDCTAAGCEIKLDKDENPLFSIEGELDPERHEGSAAITAIDEMNHKGIYSCCYAVWFSEEKHNFGKWTVSVLPAEDAEGKGTVECIDCKYKEEKTIAKLDHVHSKGTKHSEVLGTCVTMGTVEYYDCLNENCAIKLREDGSPLKTIEGTRSSDLHKQPVFTSVNETTHNEVCMSCGEVSYAEEHYFDKWTWTITALPTREAEGKKENECFYCGYKKTETIARLDHDHEKTGLATFSGPGKCITKGIVSYYDCKYCDIKLDYYENPLLTLEDDFDPEKHLYPTSMIQTNTTHKTVYDCCGVVVSEEEHTWNAGNIIIRPTLTQTGLKKTACTVCNYTKIEPVAKLEPVHTFDTDWTSDETYHWHASTSGHSDEVKDKAKHKFTEWLVTKQPANDAEGKRERECQVCQYKAEETIAKLDHVHKKGPSSQLAYGGTCLTRGTVYYFDCENKDCVIKLDKDGNVLDSIIGDYDPNYHATTDSTWIVTAETHKEIYDCCGAIKTEEAAHTMHNGVVDKLPTLVTKGVKIYDCTVCYKNTIKEDIPELYSSPVDAETEQPATKESKYVYFGAFPKSVLPADSDVTVDENVSVQMGANTCYRGSDKNYYVKVSTKISDSSYKYTDGSSAVTGKIRYFKVEPVKWKVLTANYNNTGRALLLADDILTGNVPYCSVISERYADGTIYANNYRYSTIRAYLNGIKDYQFETNDYIDKGFLQTAFSDTARALIAETEVDNRKETTGNSDDTYAAAYACANTNDKIFLLSFKEINSNVYNFTAIRKATDYAKANNVYQSDRSGEGGIWWLRSPVFNAEDTAYAVNYAGTCSQQRVTDKTEGVVPALTIELDENHKS